MANDASPSLERYRTANNHMSQKKQDEAMLRVHPFPTLVAQSLSLVDLASDETSVAPQVLAKSAIVFAAMSLECAATSCLELTRIPKGPHGKMDRTFGVVDKFDMLHWLAVKRPLERGHSAVQKIDDLVSARNELVHPRVKREPIGASRKFSVGEEIAAKKDDSVWNSLRIPRDELRWGGEDAKRAVVAAIDFLNYFFFEACKMEQRTVVTMLCTSSGDVVFKTPWESQTLSTASRKFGLDLRFLGL